MYCKLTNTRQRSIKLPDGRNLCWYESGPENGFPVVFCTGAGMSGSFGFGLDLLDTLNIRLITPDRAGLGYSSVHPQKSLQSFANDIQALLASLHIQNFSIVGFSQGGVFAMALAYYCNPISLSLVSGQDQFEYPATNALLKRDMVEMQEKAINTPDELSDWLLRNVTPQWLLAFILNCSAEIDQQVYSQEDFLESYSKCMEQAFSQGNQGYVQDLLVSLQVWPFIPEDIHCPVSLWYGELDVSVAHSPDFGQTLATRFPICEHFLLPSEGGSLLWTQANQILINLKQYCNAADNK